MVPVKNPAFFRYPDSEMGIRVWQKEGLLEYANCLINLRDVIVKTDGFRFPEVKNLNFRLTGDRRILVEGVWSVLGKAEGRRGKASPTGETEAEIEIEIEIEGGRRILNRRRKEKLESKDEDGQ